MSYETIILLYQGIAGWCPGNNGISVLGLSGPEIAEKLGITIHTVKTQKNRSFKYLREKLKDSVLLFLI